MKSSDVELFNVNLGLESLGDFPPPNMTVKDWGLTVCDMNVKSWALL